MGTTVEELISLFSEDHQKVDLYSMEKEKNVFSGTVRDLLDDDDLVQQEVMSIDPIEKAAGVLTVNIQ